MVLLYNFFFSEAFCFPFVSSLFVIAQLSIFMMAPLKPSSNNFNIADFSVLTSIVFIHLEILLVLCMMNEFLLKSGHFGYSVMRLLFLFVSLTLL